MKPLALTLAAAALAGGVAAAPASGNAQAADRSFEFKRLELEEPLNWSAGSTLFPGRVIAGTNADLGDFTAQTWAEHVLYWCKTFGTCTTAFAFQATNSGDTGGRFWFGYAFSGAPTTEDDFTREEGVTDSVAYTNTD